MQPNRSLAIEEAKQEIRQFVTETERLSKAACDRHELASHVVQGLVRSLAAHGAALWIAQSDSKTLEAPTVILECSVGELTDPAYASQVVRTGEDQSDHVLYENSPRLFIGVPLRKRNCCTGAIVVSQRDGSAAAIQSGYVRFIKQIASFVEASSDY